MMVMPSPAHELYRENLRCWCDAHRSPDLEARLRLEQEPVAMLWELDLEPAREVLQRCYAASPRGGAPHDPLMMLRLLLVAALFGPRAPNAFVRTLTHDGFLRALCGLPDTGERPGVGTLYDFLHRLHDGPRVPGQERASVREAKRAQEARLPQFVKKAKKKRGEEVPDTEAEAQRERTTQQIVQILETMRGQGNPDDLVERLTQILWGCGVRASVERGVIDSLQGMVVAGDGSPLPTNACALGNRTCGCSKKKRCECPRPIADADAAVGYDKYRKQPFFGYLFYNVLVVSKSVELPLFDSIDAANVSDFFAAPVALERLSKTVQAEGGRLSHAILDKGCDGRANHEHLRGLRILPVIAIRNNAPASHPTRPEVALSKRAIPICEAGVEMAAWGTAGPGRPSFVCPVKAKKRARCPLAPADEPGWRCVPHSKLGPSVSIKTSDNPRLFPEISRNSATYERLYARRSACERNNATKKEVHGLLECGHRRKSLWLCQLSFRSLLQHARAWLTDNLRAAVLAALLPTGPP
jgi:hypothetical protein